jgi:hypothetical protein
MINLSGGGVTKNACFVQGNRQSLSKFIGEIMRVEKSWFYILNLRLRPAGNGLNIQSYYLFRFVRDRQQENQANPAMAEYKDGLISFGSL